MNLNIFYDDVPWGVRFLQKLTENCCPRLHFNREICYRASVIFLTYIAYMCYHLSRKPISVVKAVLNRNCSDLPAPPNGEPNNWCDWAPFDGSDSNAKQLFGEIDSSFLFSYAIAMFASGFIAERVNLRYFLSLGMMLSGIFSYLLGLAKLYDIHDLWYFIVVQGLAGIVQTTGWPGVVTVMSNWFGKSKRGLIFGLWNSHTSIGNILGSLIAAEYLETDWALSFIMPGLYIGVVGFVIFLFLVVNPGDVGCTASDTSREDRYKRSRPLENRVANVDDASASSSEVDDSEILIGEQASLSPTHYLADENFEVQRRITERSRLLPSSPSEIPEEAVGFFRACCIPGVIEFSLALFFSKLVSYTFLYWLPMYVNASVRSPTLSADLSTLFDVGGILGAIIAGVLSDKTEMPASTCSVMLIFAAPMMVVYQQLGDASIGLNMMLLIVVGLLVNGPYALITTAVSAELGTHHSLGGNSKALATVTAIIDGTGSIGAAVGPLLAGFVWSYGSDKVFLMLMFADIFALLFLLRLVKHEIIKFQNSRRMGLRLE